MRVFLDTNVLVAAFATRGLCSDVLRHVIAEHEWLASRQVVAELRRALRDKLRLPVDRIDDIETFLRDEATMVEPGRSTPRVQVRDPHDIDILAAAISGAADVLVTGDADLLALDREGPPRICGPREFWSRVTEG